MCKYPLESLLSVLWVNTWKRNWGSHTRSSSNVWFASAHTPTPLHTHTPAHTLTRSHAETPRSPGPGPAGRAHRAEVGAPAPSWGCWGCSLRVAGAPGFRGFPSRPREPPSCFARVTGVRRNLPDPLRLPVTSSSRESSPFSPPPLPLPAGTVPSVPDGGPLPRLWTPAPFRKDSPPGPGPPVPVTETLATEGSGGQPLPSRSWPPGPCLGAPPRVVPARGGKAAFLRLPRSPGGESPNSPLSG